MTGEELWVVSPMKTNADKDLKQQLSVVWEVGENLA